MAHTLDAQTLDLAQRALSSSELALFDQLDLLEPASDAIHKVIVASGLQDSIAAEHLACLEASESGSHQDEADTMRTYLAKALVLLGQASV